MFSFFTSIVLLAITVGLFYTYLVWNFGFWKKRGVKQAKAYPFFGSYPSQFTARRNLVYDINDIYKKYKRTENFVGAFNTRMPQLIITSPEYVNKIFVTDFKHFHDNEFSKFLDRDPVFAHNPFTICGEHWKERRAQMSPGLTTSRVKCMFPVTQEVCKKLSDFLHKQSKMAPKDGLDAKEFCLRFTTEVVTDCVLGIKVDSFHEQPSPIYTSIKRVFDGAAFFLLYTMLSIMMPVIRNIYAPLFFSKQAEIFFSGLVKTAIDMRRKSKNDDRVDFLKQIVDLQDKKNLSLDELTSLTVTFLTDGFETSATSLSHTLLLLARYPELQEKLRREIESVGEITFENLSNLPYLDACIHEVIRIFSPQLVASKICTIPYEFVNKNGSKLRLERNQIVQIPIYSLHHDPDIYENPEEFVPERFLDEAGGEKKYREMGVYLAFGNGPRYCMGRIFALTQVKAALVEILREFTIKVNPKTRTDNYLDETYFMSLLKGGIWLDIEPRKKCIRLTEKITLKAASDLCYEEMLK